MTYSYAIIESAARSVQERSHWMPNTTVSSLQFTNKWVKSLLSRGGLRRRKTTREDKDIPESEEILQVMRIGQKLFIDNEHDENTCFNFDETAFTWAIGPTHVYCPINQERATNIGITDTKVRITAVIAVNAAGQFAPLMLILKHSVSSEKSPDQTRMTVISKLHKVEGFTELDGWKKKCWEKSLTIKGKTDIHKIIYIIHENTHHVITSQVKAWNDTARMVMWYEVLIKPIKERLGKMLLWCDNCGSHKTSSVRDVMEEIGIDVAFLPRNMTGELQVQNLVVNGPLKAHIRNNRANRLYSHFQKYRVGRAADSQLPVSERQNVGFNPPKPTQVEGMKDLIKLFAEKMTEERFKAGIKRSFLKTGTLPTIYDDLSQSPTFAEYHKESVCGTVLCVPNGTLNSYQNIESELSGATEEVEEI